MPLMSVSQFARAAGMGVRTVYRRVQAGTLEHLQVNGRIFIITGPLPEGGVPGADGVAATVRAEDDAKRLEESQSWTPQQYARRTGVTYRTVLRWVREGKVQHQRIRGQISILTDPDSLWWL